MRTNVSNKSQACTHRASPSAIRGRRNVFLIECIVKVRSWHVLTTKHFYGPKCCYKNGQSHNMRCANLKALKCEKVVHWLICCVSPSAGCVTEFSYHHNDSLSILVNNFPKSLSAIIVMCDDRKCSEHSTQVGKKWHLYN